MVLVRSHALISLLGDLIMDTKTIMASLCFITHNNRVLLLERNKKVNDFHNGRFVGVGGKVEEGESPRENVIREVREEAGLEVTPTFRGMLYESFVTTAKQKERNWVVFIYSTELPLGGTLNEDTREGTFHWVALEDVKKTFMWEGDYPLLDIILLSEECFEVTTKYVDEILTKWVRH